VFDTATLKARVEKPNSSFVVERYGPLAEMDRSFDVAYWQRLGAEAIFEAAWQLVVQAHMNRDGGEDELRLSRTVESFQPRRR
jgi:hypothetical protein